MTVERDDLKEAVTTLRRRIRDLEAANTRTTTQVREPHDSYSLLTRCPVIAVCRRYRWGLAFQRAKARH